MIIDGKKISEEILKKLKSRPNPEKIFAAILVGENPISLNFLKQKERVAKELGVDFRIYKFPETIKNDDLRKEAGKIALLKRVGGVIIQLPLPEHFNRRYILNVIPAEKDIDVLGERALGAFYNDRNPVLPPAVGVIKEILAISHLPLTTSKVAIVGLGFLIGKPIATWLMGKAAEIYLLDKGSNFSILKNADLVISGVGQAELIKPEILKEGAGVIDFGYSVENATRSMRQENNFVKKIRGDFDVNSLSMSPVALRFYTPTPNGTGPILVAKIFENFYKLNTG
jgi:5,10-methylene-tetrahydrofolate dehydrogenase/methenyl tetrahydrofolate cyclohydrolase